jgi:MOSC domain-containing protein YiiM
MLTGSCLCGAVKVRVDGKLGPVVFCHCTRCRKAGGSAFGANASVRARYLALEGREWLREYESSRDVFRAFCSRCGSPVYSRRTAEPENFRLRLGLLDGDPGRRPLAHGFVDSKAPWYEIHDELPRYGAGIAPDGRPEGRLLGIALRGATRVPMQQLERAEVTLDAGVVGDFRGRPGKRQVTLLARESWDDACRELGVALPWTTRRANLLIEGLALEQSAGRRLRIGPVLLEVTSECDPCQVMDAQHQGLRAALQPAWRGGVTCRVLEAGTLARGDVAQWEEQ